MLIKSDSSPGPAPQATRAERLVADMVGTAHGLLADGGTIGDLKIAAQTLKEMRDAFRIFSAYRGVRKVTCFGSARTGEDEAVFGVAEEFARLIAAAGFMVITGAGGGIMEACQRGAGRERSFGVNITLPFEQKANPVIDGDPKLVSFKYFFTRKLFFVKETDAVALFPGGFGTHDEGFEALTLLQTGKSQPMPVVLLDRPRGTYWKTWERYVHDHLLRRKLISPEDLSLFKIADSPEAAVQEILSFYRVYHSSRYVRDLLVLRLRRALPGPFLETLAQEFSDITASGTLIQREAFAIERDDPGIAHLPRLAFRFNRVHFGRLRSLIDRINAAPE